MAKNDTRIIKSGYITLSNEVYYGTFFICQSQGYMLVWSTIYSKTADSFTLCGFTLYPFDLRSLIKSAFVLYSWFFITTILVPSFTIALYFFIFFTLIGDADLSSVIHLLVPTFFNLIQLSFESYIFSMNNTKKVCNYNFSVLSYY